LLQNRVSVAKRVSAPVLQAGNAGRELEAKQGAQSKDMIGIAAAIGVVMPECDFALMVEQRIQHMQRLARGGRDQLAVGRTIAIREMRVDLEPGLLAVVDVAPPPRHPMEHRGEVSSAWFPCVALARGAD
jgi:hypothetical protein